MLKLPLRRLNTVRETGGEIVDEDKESICVEKSQDSEDLMLPYIGCIEDIIEMFHCVESLKAKTAPHTLERVQ